MIGLTNLCEAIFEACRSGHLTTYALPQPLEHLLLATIYISTGRNVSVLFPVKVTHSLLYLRILSLRLLHCQSLHLNRAWTLSAFPTTSAKALVALAVPALTPHVTTSR